MSLISPSRSPRHQHKHCQLWKKKHGHCPAALVSLMMRSFTNQKQLLKRTRNLQTRTAVLRSEKLSMEKIRSRSSGGSLFIVVTICISNFLESHNHSNTQKLLGEESSDQLSTRWRPRESATYREYFRPRELKECVLQGFRWLGQTPAPLRIVDAEHLCNAGSQM